MSHSGPDTTGIAAGVFFTIVGVVFLLDTLDVWDLRLAFVLPLLLIGLGTSILVGWVASTASRPRTGPR